MVFSTDFWWFCWLRLLLAATVGFPYVQTAPATVKLAVLLVAIAFGVMATIQSPQPPDYIVQDYDRNKLRTDWFSMFFAPLFIVVVTYILLSADFVSVKHLSDRSGQNILLLSMITLLASGQFSLKRVAGVSAPNRLIFLLGFAAIICAVFFLFHS